MAALKNARLESAPPNRRYYVYELVDPRDGVVTEIRVTPAGLEFR